MTERRVIIIQLIPQCDDLKSYLKSSDIIDFCYPISREITTYSKDELDYIKNAYEYVRDKISHSADIIGKEVTCKASEVLRAKEGTCFAKSHLSAAILRCNLIPTRFCYQKLILDNKYTPHLILHGLNAVYIEKYNKWIRLDARGNKEGINAQFSVDNEKLAFSVDTDRGEEDIPIIFSNPDKNVISALTNNKSFEMLWSNLPTKLNIIYINVVLTAKFNI